MIKSEITRYLKKVRLPSRSSHKGQNGKLLIIGGSELFHAASRWSLEVATKFVDMVFYASTPDNNELIKEAKGEFWNGIVVPRDEVESYLQEADCVLIGPGMMRDKETKRKVDFLVGKYPDKKWIIDAGALQVINPKLLNTNCIITPHAQEMKKLKENCKAEGVVFSKLLVNILLKGEDDKITFFKKDKKKRLVMHGGNEGMTKGGTGDVLAGLVASIYTKHPADVAMVVGSYINKKAGEELYTAVGPYYNASDLVATIPRVLWQEKLAIFNRMRVK